MQRMPFICLACKNFQSLGTLHKPGPVTCSAFPKGIPKEIVNGEWDHHTSTGTDNGVTFDLRPGHEAVLEHYYDWRNSTAYEWWRMVNEELASNPKE